MRFRTSCDMASIKIYSDSLACFFSNNLGDGSNTVEVVKTNRGKDLSKAEFLGHFTVKTEAHLSMYDCSDEPIYTFGRGRWFVYLVGICSFYIHRCDEDTHA